MDIDGTLADGGRAIPGAVEALASLKASVRGVRLVTNQSQEANAATLSRLHSEGFQVESRELFGTLAAVRRLIDQQQLRPLFLLNDAALPEFAGVPTHEPNAVVVGTAPAELHYERLSEAMRALLNDEGSQLIACNKGRYFRRHDGFAMMAGPFVAALEYATGRQALVVGKPNQDFFHAAVRDAAGSEELPAELLRQCVMIGDDARDDVQGAMDAGMQAILLRTGKYRPGDEDRLPRPPLFVAADIAEAVAFLRSEGLAQGGH